MKQAFAIDEIRGAGNTMIYPICAMPALAQSWPCWLHACDHQ
jgi:hypothetical protein